MPYLNDTGALAQIVSPSYAAMQAGVQAGQAQQAQALQNQQTQEMMPGLVQALNLKNQATQAGLPGIVGQSASQLAAGNEAQATQSSNIQAKIASNVANMSAAQVQSMQNTGQVLGQAGAYLNGIPAAARPAALNQLAQKYGVDLTKYPQLTQVDPNALPGVLSNISDQMLKGSTAWKAQQSKQQSEQSIAGTSAAGHVLGSQILAGAGVQKAQIAADVKREMGANISQQLAQYSRLQAAGQLTPAQAKAMNDLIVVQKYLGTPAVAAGVMTGNIAGIPSQPPEITPAAGTPAPATAPTSNANPPALESLLKAQGVPYEPDKYDYRIVGNTVQRKPK
ncbi:MAG: hypothetical protein KGI54_16895 [Pseudomonadota bacterium]|nr:hypothetical protein [Pseudomonadota bacterium]